MQIVSPDNTKSFLIYFIFFLRFLALKNSKFKILYLV